MAVLILLASIVFLCGIVAGWLIRGWDERRGSRLNLARIRFTKPPTLPCSPRLSDHWLIDADQIVDGGDIVFSETSDRKTLSAYPHSEGTHSGIG